MVECEEERSDCSVLIGRCCCCAAVTRSPDLARIELGFRPGAGADDVTLFGSSSTPDLKEALKQFYNQTFKLPTC